MASLRFPEDENFESPNFIMFKLYKRETSDPKALEEYTDIFLQLPNDIKTSTKIGWAGVDTGMTGEVIRAMQGDSELSLGQGSGEIINKVVSGIASNALKLFGASFDADTIAGLATKTIANPYISAMFKGVDLKNFSFTFEFYPRTIDDCKKIKEIVDTFKFASLPNAIGEDAPRLIYPMEFDIKFLTKADSGNENPFMPKFNRSVLTDFSADYAIQTFRNGHPQHISMSIGFTELEIETQVSFGKLSGIK
jgi:hypothetical protein